MKKLRRIDIDLMVNELPVMSREEQSSTVGGVLTTSNDGFSAGSDCALQAISYLSGKSVGEVTGAYKELYISTYLGEPNPDNGYKPYTRDDIEKKIKSQLDPGGTGVNSLYADKLYGQYVSSSSTRIDPSCQYNSGFENDIMNALSGNSGGLYAALKFNGVVTANGEKYDVTGNHSVVIVDYDSGTKKFTYYDPQQKASGTFDWEDLNYTRYK